MLGGCEVAERRPDRVAQPLNSGAECVDRHRERDQRGGEGRVPSRMSRDAVDRSFATAVPIIVSPTAVGLDRALRTWVPGAAAARWSARTNAAITNSVMRFECSLGIPNTRDITRWRASFSRWKAIAVSPTNSLAPLRCSGRRGGGDCVSGITRCLFASWRSVAYRDAVPLGVRERRRLAPEDYELRGDMAKSLTVSDSAAERVWRVVHKQAELDPSPVFEDAGPRR